MGHRGWSVGVLVAIGVIWFASSTQREKPVVGDLHSARIATLEDNAAASPQDPQKLRELAQGYLEARQPGMAQALIDHAPEALRKDPMVEHVYGRALLDQGRAADALAAERRVLASCGDPSTEIPQCSTYLIASATRRVDILEQLVQLGVEDANAHPESANVAYHNATRQVTLAVAH
jgi:hypothetical protein